MVCALKCASDQGALQRTGLKTDWIIADMELDEKYR